VTERQIQRFFRVLSREFSKPARLIVTGAAAGSLWGAVRPSLDIDFGVTMVGADRGDWEAFAGAVARTVQLTGIRADYAEDLDRWGAIALLDYQRHTLLYRAFGQLDVRLLDPVYWSIGKISRYLDPDVRDLVAVCKRRRLPADRLITLWARALRSSPPSTACTLFRTQVEHFLRTYGRVIWGKRFDTEDAIRQFHQQFRRS